MLERVADELLSGATSLCGVGILTVLLGGDIRDFDGEGMMIYLQVRMVCSLGATSKW